MRDEKRARRFEPEYGEPVDPIPDNPFQPGDERFQVWNEATTLASAGVRQGVAEAFRRQQLAGTAVERNHWRMVRVLSEFSTWAERSACLVWSDNEMREFGGWIADRANRADRFIRPFLEGTPIEQQTGAEVFEGRLQAEILRLKGVAAMCVAGRAQALKIEAPIEPPRTGALFGGPALARWLKKAMKDEGYEINRVSVLSGIDRKTIKKLLGGGRSRESTLDKIAAVFGKQFADLPNCGQDVPIPAADRRRRKVARRSPASPTRKSR